MKTPGPRNYTARAPRLVPLLEVVALSIGLISTSFSRLAGTEDARDLRSCEPTSTSCSRKKNQSTEMQKRDPDERQRVARLLEGREPEAEEVEPPQVVSLVLASA